MNMDLPYFRYNNIFCTSHPPLVCYASAEELLCALGRDSAPPGNISAPLKIESGSDENNPGHAYVYLLFRSEP